MFTLSTLQGRKAMQKMLNRLALAPIRECRSLHSCILCGKDITLGQRYRDKGYAARAHEDCFKEAAKPAVTIARLTGGTLKEGGA